MDGFQYLAQKHREKQQKEWDAEGRPTLRDQYVSDPGHEVPIEGFTRQSTVGKIGWAAVEHGWTVKMGEAEYVTAERWVKSTIVPGKPQKHHWVNAVSPDRKHYISVSKILLMCDGEIVDDKEEVLIHLDEFGVRPEVAADSGA